MRYRLRCCQWDCHDSRNRSSRIDVGLSNAFIIRCYNFNLYECRVANNFLYRWLSQQRDGCGYVAKIYGPKKYEGRLFPPYMRVEKDGVSVFIRGKEVKPIWEGDAIYLFIPSEIEGVDEFFYSPSMPRANIGDHTNSVAMRIDIKAEDMIYYDREGNHLSLDCNIQFRMVVESGYDRNGIFRVKKENCTVESEEK